MLEQQLSLFDELYERKIIKKPIRLIELFAGIGSQFKALKQLTNNVESYKICEWAYNSIISYNAIHTKDNRDYSKGKTRDELLKYLNGNISINYNEPADLIKKSDEWLRNCYNNCIATHNLMNIMKVKGKDLEITNKDKYEYILTYSFPCQDLSLAGKRQGMKVSQANGGTRSGLLWEVERILTELHSLSRERESNCMPDILVMENVPEVIGTNNINDFNKWELKLEQLGYQCYVKILNAKNYGIPQNRKRCFMVSILGDYAYTLPRETKLKYKLKDLLERNVDEKYYLTEKQISDIKKWNAYEKPLEKMEITDKSQINPTITTRTGDYTSSMCLVKEKKYIGTYDYAQSDTLRPTKEKRTHIDNDISGTNLASGNHNGVIEQDTLKKELCNELINKKMVNEWDIVKHSYTKQIMSGNKKCVEKSDETITLTTRGDCVGVCVNQQEQLRIRKLTPLECMNLMGFEKADYECMVKVGLSDMNIYHCAGDSIVVNVLICIFGELLNIDYVRINNEYVNKVVFNDTTK